MQDDLQASEHLPQRVHLTSSNLILKIDIFEIRPRKVPTGQIVLQNNLPLEKDIITTSSKNADGIA